MVRFVNKLYLLNVEYYFKSISINTLARKRSEM